MEDKTFSTPTYSGFIGKSIIRKTNEEVEVIDFEIKSRGERSDEDWVTYIDSNGEEYIKENLNAQLDFKSNDTMTSLFSKVLAGGFNSSIPSTNNQRVYDISKEIMFKGNYTIDDYDIDKVVKAAHDLVMKIDELKL